MAGEVLTDQAEDMVTAWRTRLAEHPHLAIYSAAPDGSLNPDYSAASKPRFVRWVIDACTRPFDQTWLDYQQEIGLRHTRDKKNVTDHVESVDHIPLRYLLSFTAVVLVTARDYLAHHGHSTEDVEKMHAAWTKPGPNLDQSGHVARHRLDSSLRVPRKLVALVRGPCWPADALS
jgi:Protoglobin